MGFHVGDLVRIVPRFCSASEQSFIYAVTNINTETDRIIISCINSLLTFQPSETVSADMIELVWKGE